MVGCSRSRGANREGRNMPERQGMMEGVRRVSLALGVAVVASSAADGQFSVLGGPTSGAQVLVIGTYHMSNPGLDPINIRADDVLMPKRQREIEELAARVARFRPTKVAIELPWGRDSTANAFYLRYVARSHTPDRTEMQQLGFRIAKAAGLPRVYGVDYRLDVNIAGVMVAALMGGQPALAAAVQGMTSRLV